jgi:hypothetical protein
LASVARFDDPSILTASLFVALGFTHHTAKVDLGKDSIFHPLLHMIPIARAPTPTMAANRAFASPFDPPEF